MRYNEDWIFMALNSDFQNLVNKDVLIVQKADKEDVTGKITDVIFADIFPNKAETLVISNKQIAIKDIFYIEEN